MGLVLATPPVVLAFITFLFYTQPSHAYVSIGLYRHPRFAETFEIKREVETKRFMAEYPENSQRSIRSKRFVGHPTTTDGENKLSKFNNWLKTAEEGIKRSVDHDVDMAQSRLLGLVKDEQVLSNRLLVAVADAVMGFLNDTRRDYQSRVIGEAKRELLHHREREVEYRNTFEMLATRQNKESYGWGAIHTTLQIVIYLAIFALPCIIIIYCLRLAMLRRQQRMNTQVVLNPGAAGPGTNSTFTSPAVSRQVSGPSMYSLSPSAI